MRLWQACKSSWHARQFRQTDVSSRGPTRRYLLKCRRLQELEATAEDIHAALQDSLALEIRLAESECAAECWGYPLAFEVFAGSSVAGRMVVLVPCGPQCRGLGHRSSTDVQLSSSRSAARCLVIFQALCSQVPVSTRGLTDKTTIEITEVLIALSISIEMY